MIDSLLLQSLHVVYLLSIGSIPPTVIRKRIVDFLEKFVATLMEVFSLYLAEPVVKKVSST